VGCELQTRLMDGHTFADASEHILQRPALGDMVEHVIGRHERRARAFRQLSKSRNAGAVVALIAIRGSKIDGGWCERGFDALKLVFEALSVFFRRRRLCGGSIFRRRLSIQGCRMSPNRKRNNRSPAGIKLLSCLPQCFAPTPVLRRQSDKDLALVVGRYVFQKQCALPFFSPALTEREEAAEAAIGGAVRGQAE